MVPMKPVNRMSIINFIRQHIIHRFDLSKTITMDQWSIFTGQEVKNLAEESKFKIIIQPLIMHKGMDMLKQQIRF